MFYRDERLALFIDGANLYAAARALGFDIDYKLLRTEFMRRGKLLRAFYYTALLESEEYSPIRPLVDWLNYNGFAMVTKPAKEFTDSTGRRKVKGNMDIELAVDAMEMAPHVDHIVLFSGDGDFKPLVESLQRQGVRVSVVSTIRSSPPMIADELRRQCDNFIELDELREVIGRPPRGEQARRHRRHRRRGRMTPPRRRATARAAPGSSPTAGRTPPGTRTGSTAPSPRSATREARLLVLGLAPGVAGANRTGRPFTGDYAGELLYATLTRFGFANGRFAADPADGLALPTASSRTRCAACRRRTSRRPPRSPPAGRSSRPASPPCPGSAPCVCLGRIAHETLLRALGRPPRRPPVRARRPPRDRPARGLRQLPLLALQHQHRPADRGDVRGGVRRGPRQPRRGAGVGAPAARDRAFRFRRRRIPP